MQTQFSIYVNYLKLYAIGYVHFSNENTSVFKPHIGKNLTIASAS